MAGHQVLPGATPAISFLGLGGLIAADRQLSPRMVTAITIFIGSLHTVPLFRPE
jgi:hypothetical protein